MRDAAGINCAEVMQRSKSVKLDIFLIPRCSAGLNSTYIAYAFNQSCSNGIFPNTDNTNNNCVKLRMTCFNKEFNARSEH